MNEFKIDKAINGMTFKFLVKKHKDGTTTIIIDNITRDIHSKTLYQLSETDVSDLIKFLQEK